MKAANELYRCLYYSSLNFGKIIPQLHAVAGNTMSPSPTGRPAQSGGTNQH